MNLKTFNKFINESDTNEYLYHATYKPLLKKIQTEGLGGKSTKPIWTDSKKGLVYLANDPHVAESYAEAAFDENEDLPESWMEKIVILKINKSKLNLSKLSKDANVIDGDATFEYSGIIPWDCIEIEIE